MSPRDVADLEARFRAYRASADRALRDELIEEHRWLGIHCAHRFTNRGVATDDLEQVAMLGVLKAVERYDPDKGVRFSSFAMPTILGELRRHFRDTTWAVHVPRGLKELYQTVSQAAQELQGSLGRSPTVAEVADRAGVPVEDALEALDVRGCYRGLPLDSADDEDAAGANPLGVQDTGFDAAEARVTVRALMATLPSELDREVVHLRFVEDMTQSQIAERLGTNQVRVSRLLRANLDRMRRKLLR